jgi:hypothetical protein
MNDDEGRQHENRDYGSPDCPLVRISETTLEECKRLTELLDALSTGELRRGAIHELSEHVCAVGCQLIAKTGRRDMGMLQVGPNVFECILKRTTWDNVAGLVAPFSKDLSGFQWLDDSSGIRWLLSPTGTW